MANVLVACEFSGRVRDAFRARGHNAYSCDLLETEKPGDHFQCDLVTLLNVGFHWDLMIAHPPCTYLTCAGNKWFKPEFSSRFPNREAQRKDAIAFVKFLAEVDIPRIAIENPRGVLSTSWRKPDQIIQPYQFGDPSSKETHLWLKGLPPLAHTKIVEVDWYFAKNGRRYSRDQRYEAARLRGSERTKFRSRTYPGIAEAMAEQWGGII